MPFRVHHDVDGWLLPDNFSDLHACRFDIQCDPIHVQCFPGHHIVEFLAIRDRQLIDGKVALESQQRFIACSLAKGPFRRQIDRAIKTSASRNRSR